MWIYYDNPLKYMDFIMVSFELDLYNISVFFRTPVGPFMLSNVVVKG